MPLLSSIAQVASTVVDFVTGQIPVQGTLIGALQLAGGKFVKQFTTDDVPNEIILPFSMAVSMLGWMLVNSGAHPDLPMQRIAELSLWPAMKQFVVITGAHSISKNTGSLVKIATEAAANFIPGGTVVGKLIRLLPWFSGAKK